MNIRVPAGRLCLFFFLAVSVCLSCSGQQTEILSPEERSWLSAHRNEIVVVQDRYYAPYEFCPRDSDIVQGMMYDYMSLIEKKLNVRFPRRSPRDLSDNLETMKQRKAAVINAVTKTPERSAYLLFTDPVIEMRNVILVRKEYKGDADLGNLPRDPSFSISTVADYSITKYMQREYPSYNYDIVSSDLKALLNVSYGISGAAVVDLATASYLCEKEGISNLRVAGDAGKSNMLAIGSRSDWPELNSILNKAVKSIRKSEQDDIYKQWINLEDTRIWKNKTFRIVLFSVGGFSLMAVCLVLLWNRQLSLLVRIKTRELSESEERFRLLVEQAPEAIVLLDADRDRLVEVNRNAEILFGCSRGELLDAGIRKFYPMMRDDVLSLTDSGKKNATVAAHEISMSEREIRTSDGRDIFCEVRLSLFPSFTKRLIRASFIDITERKLSEARQLRLNRELLAVSACNQALVRATDEQTLVNDICRIICNEAGYRMAWIGYAQNDPLKTVKPVCWAGIEDGYLRNAVIRWDESEFGRGPTGSCIRTGKRMYVHDFDSAPEPSPWRNAALQRGYHSSIAFPLFGEDGMPMGALNIYSSEREVFFEEELRLLDELAGDLSFGIITLRGRVKRLRAEETLRNSLQEKETLLRELYHRTKNNMQVITSLLRLHAESLSDSAARQFVIDMQNRILAMSLAHQKLYHSKNLSRINLHEYINDLAGQSLCMYVSAPERISFLLDIADEYIAIDAAIPLGLILSELLIHSYRQSFPGERKGEIRIQLMRNENGEIVLTYADNGAGMYDGSDSAENGTLGMKTVCALGADQLKGRVTFPPGNGFHFMLVFNDTMFKTRV